MTAQNLFLHTLHEEMGAKMVPFAGYMMPIQYDMGIIKEHLHTRKCAGLFDISHMGQLTLQASNDTMPDAILEEIVAASITSLKPGKMRYTQLLNADGGIIDDIMVTRDVHDTNMLYIVCNGACKEKDFAYLTQHINNRCEILWHEHTQLVALQGPTALEALKAVTQHHALQDMAFMSMQYVPYKGAMLIISRSGYSGEDGFEISLPTSCAEPFMRDLLAVDAVSLIGLGARDSLRIEAGLCLYGHELDEHITPVQAGIEFSISKKRIETGGYKGHDIIKKQYEQGAPYKRAGLLSEKRPIREGTKIYNSLDEEVGIVTSGAYCASIGKPAVMAYINIAEDNMDNLYFMVRDTKIPAVHHPLPFIVKSYKK